MNGSHNPNEIPKYRLSDDRGTPPAEESTPAEETTLPAPTAAPAPQSEDNYYFDYTAEYRTAPHNENERPENVPNTLGVVSLILGIIGFWFCSGCFPPLSIAAIVLAALDRKKAGRFRGMAVAGLVLGILGLLATVAIVGFVGLFFFIAMEEGAAGTALHLLFF